MRRTYSWNDIAIALSIPWYGLASGVLVLRRYQGLLSRIVYMSLLFYWLVWLSGGGPGPLSRYTNILVELLRSRTSDRGERDEFGRHWKLNIATYCIEISLTELLCYFFPDWFWSTVVLNVLLSLIVFGHAVVQLFLQKQIARLVRFDQSLFRWRDYALEYFCYRVTSHLNNKVARTFVWTWWWAWYKVYKLLSMEVMSRIAFNLLGLAFLELVFYGSQSAWYGRTLKFMIFYRVWLQELAKFSNPEPTEYKYSKLESAEDIRLILLHPRFGFRPVSCSLLQGPHMRLLFYEAVSYTWGSPKRVREIMVDGCTMRITESVYEILVKYSSHFLPQLLWIDAICIDQGNNKEKEQQVPMMDKIYSQALFTTVFLGQSSLPGALSTGQADIWSHDFGSVRPQGDQTRNHIEAARFTIDLFNEFHILESPLKRVGTDVYVKYEWFSMNSTRIKQWSSLLTLLQHPWFARVWVVQEVALSADVRVRYGEEVIDWTLMASALRTIYRLRHFRLWLEWTHGVKIRHTEHSSLYNIIRMHNMRENLWPSSKYDYRKDITITDVLEQSLYFKATNPADQIYGLMSLCSDKGLLRVDYEMPVEKIYVAAATELARRQSFRLLFGAAGVGNRLGSGPIASKLPSWVPDWTDAPKYSRIRHPDEDRFGYGIRRSHNVVKPLQPLIIVVHDKILAMSATFVDNIAEIGHMLYDAATVEQSDDVIGEMCHLWANYDKCRKFLATSRFASDPYLHGGLQQTLLDAFHHSIVTNHDVELIDWTRHLEVFSCKPDTSTAGTRERIYTLLQSMDDVTEKVESHCGGRRVFVTRQGWMGLCPPGTRSEDEIWVVRGVKIPIILRKTGDGLGKQYNLVGECYCHGLEPDVFEAGLAGQTIQVV